MSDSRYVVELELKRVGDFKIDEATKKAEGLDKGLKRVSAGLSDMTAGATKLTSALDWAVQKVGAVAVAGAMIGATAGVAALTYGVLHLNNEAEKAAISIGTIFSANGIAANVPAGVVMAKDTIAQMRKDAQALPGEFEDLQNIFMTAAIPMFQGGASVKQAEQLSAKAMAAAAVMNLPMDMAAREFAQLIAGRAGAHNILGTRLGFSGARAQEFNKEGADKRLADVTKELDKYAGAIDVFSSTYEAQSSTLVDNLKNFGRTATAGVFDSVKTTLADVNAWFAKNQDDVTLWAGQIGRKLQDAFEWGKRKILEWYPIVENFADTAWVRLKDFWQEVQPAVESVSAAVRRMLEDPNGTIDKLITLGEIWLALKGAGMVANTVGAGVQLYAGAAKLLGAGTAGVAAGGTGAAASTAATAGAALTPYAIAAAIPAAIAGGLFYGAFGGVKSQAEHDNDDTARGKAMANKEWEDAVTAGKATRDVMIQSRDEISYMNTNFQSVTAAAYELQMGALYAANALHLAGGAFVGGEQAFQDQERETALELARAFNHPAEPESGRKIKPQHNGGHGGTNIQKVEIVVTTNQSPSRVARAIEARLSMNALNRRVSPFVRNFSSREDE